MRLFTRGVAAVLVLFGIIGLLFGLEISDIERGQTQAICGAVLLVGGVLAYLVSEVMARLDALLGAVTAGQPQARAQERAPERPQREAIAPPAAFPGDETPAAAEPAERQPLWEAPPQTAPSWTAPSWQAPSASTDHVDAAMAAVAAALGTAEEDALSQPAAQAAPAAAEPREATRPGLAAVFGAKTGLEPGRRPSLFERARAERAPAPRQEPAAPANPFTPSRPFGSAEAFTPSATAEPVPETPVLNLRPTLAADPAPAPEQPAPEKTGTDRPRPSLRALAASRNREETMSAGDPAAPAERAAEKAPEKPPLPRDIFHRTMARSDEASGADMRLRERLAALRGDPVPASEPAPPPTAAPTPAPLPRTAPANPSEEVVGRYESNGSTYVMYADGTIEAETETGVFRLDRKSVV